MPSRGRPPWCSPILVAFLLLSAVVPLTTASVRQGVAHPPDPRLRPGFQAAFARLPLVFEPAADGPGFVSRAPGYVLTVHAGRAALVTGHGTLGMSPLGGNPSPAVVAADELRAKVHYLHGSDPAGWRTHVPTYGRVGYRDVYPGIDLVFYGNGRELEYDFVVAPGADPGAIILAFEGSEGLALGEDGALTIRTPAGSVRLRRPRLYQEHGGRKTDVAGGFVLRGGDRVGFRVGPYDRGRPLVIDPVLEYSTYLGGGDPAPRVVVGSGWDAASAIAVDGAGNSYVAGSTNSTNFPVTAGVLQTRLAVGLYGCGVPASRCPEAFVAKFDPQGALLWATYLGGDEADWGTAIAVDAAGHAYMAGATQSLDFPTTPGAFQRVHGRLTCGDQYDSYPCADAFVAKLSPDGAALVYSTRLGGTGVDSATGIAVDGAGRAAVTGWVAPGRTLGPPHPVPDFPTLNAVQPHWRGGVGEPFVAKFDPAGSALVYSTFLGGSGEDRGQAIAMDADGNAYVTGATASADFPTVNALQPVLAGGPVAYELGGSDAFVVKLSATGSLVYATFLGGTGNDWGYGVAVDVAGNAYVTGTTGSSDFPGVDPLAPPVGGYDNVFVAKLAPDGQALSYSFRFGGSGYDTGYAIAVDTMGRAYVTGSTRSRDFPTRDPVQLGCADNGDAFVVRLGPGGLESSTCLGGSDEDVAYGIAVDAAGRVYVAGRTRSPDFPVVNAWQPAREWGCAGSCWRDDAFLARIALSDAPAPPAPPARRPRSRFDFDGDGRADFVIFRPERSDWLIITLERPTAWGMSGDVPVPADYTGAGRTEIAVYRPSTGEWFIAGRGQPVPWGAPALGDVPVPADYDGDGRDDIAVYRGTTGEWFIQGREAPIHWGAPHLGDVPVPADYDGDGRDDVAVYRATTGEWFISGRPTPIGWGAPSLGDVPVPADYDGDGKADIAVYRTTTGEWFILRSSGGMLVQGWGMPSPGDIPVPADYTGDGKTDIAVYRPGTGEWFVLPFFRGASGGPILWGQPGLGDVPVTGRAPR